MAEEKGLVKYVAKSGSEISLTFENVRKYLVSGRRELVTQQEMMMFMGVCKERKLNPFARDCFLIKYTEKDPAAIITSIDFFRSRAKAQKDCRGWRKGIIVEDEKGNVKRTNGLILEGERLLGGWFSAMPEGWTQPFELEVNLSGYIKKTSTGDVTRFWKEENQPTMIAKIAESQGLRTLWPDEFQGLLTQEEGETSGLDYAIIDVEKEMEAVEEREAEPQEGETPVVKTAPATFEDLVKSKFIDPSNKYLLDFLNRVARKQENPTTVEMVKEDAAKKFDEFWKFFEADMKKQQGEKVESPGETRTPPDEPEPPKRGRGRPPKAKAEEPEVVDSEPSSKASEGLLHELRGVIMEKVEHVDSLLKANQYTSHEMTGEQAEQITAILKEKPEKVTLEEMMDILASVGVK